MSAGTRPQVQESAPAPAAELRQVTFRFGDSPGEEPVLDRVDLTVEARDFLGLIGPNGGGKTTLLRLLLGLLNPTAGTVRVFGAAPAERRGRVGYVPQHARLDPAVPATVLEVVLMGRLGWSPWGFRFGRAHREAALGALAEVGMADLARRSAAALSGGERQRVLLARALASEPRLLLLDEPTAGVDLHMEQTIHELLAGLNRRLPIVLVSHDVAFVSRYVKRVACLNRRLAVHDAGEVTHEVIRELYDRERGLKPVAHRHDCPLPGGEEGRP